MSCLGVLFAVDFPVVRKLRNTPADDRPDFVAEEIEEELFDNFPERTCELDKSWDAMHRLLSDGTLSLGADKGTALAILGGEVIYPAAGEDDYIITAKSPMQVKEVFRALKGLSDEDIRKRYEAIPDEEYGEFKNEEDFQYTLEYLRDSISFWKNAALNDLWVLFTADQ
ncbi:DUF1877 family protein [Ruminococcus sp.]|uniref:DUF1877 family protein n=1 Tax=Ruminococcus sp. TaxID=41978 RepID=UPI0025FCCA99|nr:DUF1877 family protein [Ruminococcus sp.]MBQ8966397.1 YfbM family protein [Ruminococcus sp.]